MNAPTARLLDRLGAVAGIAAVVLLAVVVTVLPAMPPPSESASAVAADVRLHTQGLLAVAYLASLMDATLLVFGAVVAARLRRAGDAGWALVAVVGIAATTIHLVASALSITFVRAVGHGVGGAALWVGYGGDHWLGTLVAIPLAVFLVGASAGSHALRQLPRALTWTGFAGAAALTAGAGSVVGDELTGGALGTALLLGYLLFFVWVLGTSVVLMRAAARSGAMTAPERAPSAA
jgi:hypothetical protein